MKSPDQVCLQFASRKVRLSVEKLDKEYVLIEGDKQSLEFLGTLLLAQARDRNDCHNYLHPRDPGSVFFRKDSVLGLYIHRIPCLEKNGKPLARGRRGATKPRLRRA